MRGQMSLLPFTSEKRNLKLNEPRKSIVPKKKAESRSSLRKRLVRLLASLIIHRRHKQHRDAAAANARP